MNCERTPNMAEQLEEELDRDAAPGKKRHQVNGQTMGEEIANSITHGIGAGVSVAALTMLVVFASQQGDAWKIVSFSIYGSALVILYLASTFYHGFQSPRVKRFFRILDHCAIFLLIAGTYTPFTLVTLRGAWGWSIFGAVWGLAALGILSNTIFPHRFEKATVGLYLAMGWIVVFAFKPTMAALDSHGLAWMVVGGLSYTLGVVFYAWEKLPYSHTIWHLFVLAGSVCHFFAILLHVLPA